MSLKSHAETELAILAGPESDPMQSLMSQNALELVECFSKQGHSGFSASYLVGILERLLRYKPLTPLTGAEDEWVEVGPGVYQNKRMSSVFKDATRYDGKPYWLDGKVFSDDGGKTWYTNRDSVVVIEFPWMPPESERVILAYPPKV